MNKRTFYRPERKHRSGCALLTMLFAAILVFGEIRCIYKAISCNWEPVGKAEILYTGASLTGLGAIVGYFDIEDK